MRRASFLRPALLVAVAGAAVGASVAYAADLVVTSSKLTVFAQCIAKASADTNVAQGSPTINHGTDTSMLVVSSLTQARRALVKFDLSPCRLSSGSQVLGARLELFRTTGASSSRTHDVHRVTAAWTETGVTWNTQPATGGVVASAAVPATINSWAAWTVTSEVAAFAGGTVANEGWLVRDPVEANPTTDYRYVTRENGTATQHPKLTIDFYP